MSNDLYGESFYSHRYADTEASAVVVLSVLLKYFTPSSAVDVGCGIGVWLKVLKQMGAERIAGIDGPWVPHEHLVIPENCFICQDISDTFEINGNYDIAVCLEAAEHLPPSAGDRLARQLVNSAPLVLFSAAVPGQTGDGHVNEQWPDYWIDKFRQQGYSFADIIRPAVWENEDVLWWYAQNTFLFFRDGFFDEKGVELPVPANKPVFPLKCLHPECFEMISSALSAVSGASGFGGGILTAYIKSLLPVLAVRGYILYGAGRHTEWFLGLCEDFGLQKPECVIDDRAAGQAGLAGITVKPPDQCIVRNKWIVLSSDVPETAGKMLENLIAAGYDSRFIVDLYSNFPSGPYLKE